MIKMQQFRETIKQRKKIINSILQSVDYKESMEVTDDDLLMRAILELVSAKKNQGKFPEATKWQIEHAQNLLEKAMKEIH